MCKRWHKPSLAKMVLMLARRYARVKPTCWNHAAFLGALHETLMELGS